MPRFPSILGVIALCFAVGLFLHGCEETPEPTSPSLARVKPDRTLTVTGSGTGSGYVTAAQVGEATLNCEINAGTYDPNTLGVCKQIYGWKSTVVLTATPKPGTASTFTGWSGNCTGTGTCKVVMTQNRTVGANFSGQGVSYTLTVASAGTGSGTIKSQTGLSPAINCTVTTGTATGTCSGTYPNATSVVLTATATTGSFDGWTGSCSGTGTCTLAMTSNRAVTGTFTAPPGPEATVGKWDPPASTSPVIALHLSQLTNGKLLLWGHGGEPQTLIPGAGLAQVTNNTCTDPTTCELFCAGHTYLADGRLLVAGGHDELLGDGNGLKQASIFNGTSWAPTGSMAYGRWYPTLVTLEGGHVVAIAGSQSPGISAAIPERYNGTGWTALSGASLSLPLYPRAFLEPKNGWIFLAGEGTPRYLDPSGSGRWLLAPARVVGDRTYGSAVMLDSKVLYIGGGGGTCPTLVQNTAEVIDLSAASPIWSAVAPMAFRRRQTNATILPDGKVLVLGGTAACGFTTQSGAVYAAEVYDPDPAAALDPWTTWASGSVVRVYHSTSALLYDGRVALTGGGDGGGVSQQYSYEIFSPPYLFKGPRPSYSLQSTAMKYGQPFVVQSADAASITKVTIIRLTSTTHAFDMGQRLNTLAFQKAADGLSLTLTPPASGRIAPPGPYMLFILNGNGVPSVAQTVLLSQ